MMDRIDCDEIYCEQMVDKFLTRCGNGEFKTEFERRIYQSLIPQTQQVEGTARAENVAD